MSKVLSLPPNPALCKQTDTVYCRRSLVSDEGNKVLLTWPHGTEQNCYKAFLNGSSCFVCTVPHLLLSILFSSVVFIYSWLFLNLQSWALVVSLLPETWDSLKCHSVPAFVHFFPRSPQLLPLRAIIQEGVSGVMQHGQFLVNWKINQATETYIRRCKFEVMNFYIEKELVLISIIFIKLKVHERCNIISFYMFLENHLSVTEVPCSCPVKPWYKLCCYQQKCPILITSTSFQSE